MCGSINTNFHHLLNSPTPLHHFFYFPTYSFFKIGSYIDLSFGMRFNNKSHWILIYIDIKTWIPRIQIKNVKLYIGLPFSLLSLVLGCSTTSSKTFEPFNLVFPPRHDSNVIWRYSGADVRLVVWHWEVRTCFSIVMYIPRHSYLPHLLSCRWWRVRTISNGTINTGNGYLGPTTIVRKILKSFFDAFQVQVHIVYHPDSWTHIVLIHIGSLTQIYRG